MMPVADAVAANMAEEGVEVTPEFVSRVMQSRDDMVLRLTRESGYPRETIEAVLLFEANFVVGLDLPPASARDVKRQVGARQNMMRCLRCMCGGAKMPTEQILDLLYIGGWRYSLANDLPNDRWQMRLEHRTTGRMVRVEADTDDLAIREAAIRAMGVEVPEDA